MSPASSALPSRFFTVVPPGSVCMCVCVHTQSCLTLFDPMDCSPPDSSGHEDSSGQNTGVGSHSLLQGIFSAQRLKTGLLHCRQILYHVNHKRSPIILEWVAYPFSRMENLNPGIEPVSPVLKVNYLSAELPGKPLWLLTQ